MNVSRWNTKEDVLHDLATVTGVRPRDFDESFMVRGEKPPPQRQNLFEDLEMQLQYGSILEAGPFDAPMVPDLVGITQHIRMVNEYDTPEVITEQQTKEPLPTEKYIISKLNPNVKEFRPKSSHTCSSCSNEERENCIDSKPKSELDVNNDKEVKNYVDKTSDIKPIALTDTNMEDEEFKLANELLKNRIILASKSSTLQHKTEKNVAIAALLKLHSKPNNTVSTSPKKQCNSSKPILFTPEYFERAPALRKLELNSSASQNSVKSFAEPNISDTFIPSSSNSATPKHEELDSLKMPSKMDELCDGEPSLYSRLYEEDAQMKDSIEKVKRWMDEPVREPEIVIDRIAKSPKKTKEPKPAIYLQPVTFKKKDATIASRSSSPSSIVKTKASARSYVPSKYASDLAKQYEERKKTKEARNTDIWTRLEIDLKKRDEEIKKKRMEKENVDENLNLSSSSVSSTH